MKALIKYEFLKILRRKTTLIVMAASLLITMVFFGMPILQFQTYNRNGVIQGLEGIEYEKGQYAEISVLLTNDYITEMIFEVQELFKNPDNVGYDGYEQFLIEDAYWNAVAPKESLLNMIANNYVNPNESIGYNKLVDLDVSGGADFYEARLGKIEKILNSSSKGLSDAEKDYWRSMNSKVEEPFQYGYYEGWKVIITEFELLMFAVLAALLFGVLAFTIHVVLAVGVSLAGFGIEGWNLPLQINGTIVPYPLTFFEGTFVNLGVIYLVLIAMISLTLILSAKMKSSYLVLIIMVPVLFLPLFLSPNGTTGIYNLFVFLTPYQSLTPNFGAYISYQFGTVVLDAFAMRAVMYLVLSLIMFPIAGRDFQKHQIT